MERSDIINLLIKKNNFKSYLEIGLDKPDFNFTKINCEIKHSVDPYFIEDHEYGLSVDKFEEAFKYLTYRLTSDEFFEKTQYKYDIIFIDGLHTERQCGKDIINGLKHLNENGFIIVHDCLPVSEESQIVPRKTAIWTGDIWKCIPELKKQFIEYNVVDCDFGCGIIKYTPDYMYLHYLEKSNYEYRDFVLNRNELMNVISVEEFMDKYIN